jgi:hypothetical protein
MSRFFDGKSFNQWNFPSEDCISCPIFLKNAGHDSAIDGMNHLSEADRRRVKILLQFWGNGTASVDTDTIGAIHTKYFADITGELMTGICVDPETDNKYFFFEDGAVKSSSLYLANDQTADVVGVFETENMDSAKMSVRTYLETTKLQNQNYNPDEVFKIDNAVIDDNGKTLILIVCDDLESAKKEAKTALGK